MFDTYFLSRRAKHFELPKKAPLSQEISDVVTYLTVTLLFMMLIASFIFLFNTSKTAQQGFTFRQNGIINRELQEQNGLLKEQVLKSQSVDALLQSPVIKTMEKAENPRYVLPSTDRLTQR